MTWHWCPIHIGKCRRRPTVLETHLPILAFTSTGEKPRSSRLTLWSWTSSLDEDLLEVVDSFTYLGGVVDIQGGTEADIKARIDKARAVFLHFKNVWSSKDVTLNRLMPGSLTAMSSLFYYMAQRSGEQQWQLQRKCRPLSTPVYKGSCGYVGQSPSTMKTYCKAPTRGLQMLRSWWDVGDG